MININNLLEYNDVDEEENIIEFNSLSNRKYNELIKKLMINILYDNSVYPKEVIEFIKKEYEKLNFCNKDILYNGEKFIVCNGKNEKGYKVHDISLYAKKGYIEFTLNGNKLYLNPNSYYIDDLNDYMLSFVSENLGKIFNSNINKYDVVNYEDDISDVKSMPIGSVIGYMYEGDEYKLTKVSQDEKTITFLLGRKGSYKRDRVLYTFDIDSICDFEFCNILTDKKLEYSLSKALRK